MELMIKKLKEEVTLLKKKLIDVAGGGSIGNIKLSPRGDSEDDGDKDTPAPKDQEKSKADNLDVPEKTSKIGGGLTILGVTSNLNKKSIESLK